MKKSIVLIPLPSLIIKKIVLSLSLSFQHTAHTRFQGFIELLAPGPSTHGTH